MGEIIDIEDEEVNVNKNTNQGFTNNMVDKGDFTAIDKAEGKTCKVCTVINVASAKTCATCNTPIWLKTLQIW